MNEQTLARLLVLCARPWPGPDTGEEVLRLAGTVRDWDRVLAKADDEGTLPLVYWSLRDDPGSVPSSVLESLRLSFLRNTARTAQIYRELELFLEPVRRSGLRVALTKGGRLALELYPDPALRPFWDVDFIVHTADWPSVTGILGRLGYVAATGEGEASRGGPRLDWTFSPYYRKGPVVLEFHFASLGLHFRSGVEDDHWPSAGRLNVRGTEAMVLPAEHELCYLCVHAQQHSYQKLIWLADIAGMASRQGLDWDWVVRISRAERIVGPVAHGLRLADALWPGAVPSAPLRGLRPGPVEDAMLRALWPERSTAARRLPPAWPYYMPSLFSLWERRSPGLAGRTLAGILFPPRAWLAANYGLPQRSLRLYARYLERILRPAVTAAKRLTAAR